MEKLCHLMMPLRGEEASVAREFPDAEVNSQSDTYGSKFRVDPSKRLSLAVGVEALASAEGMAKDVVPSPLRSPEGGCFIRPGCGWRVSRLV